MYFFTVYLRGDHRAKRRAPAYSRALSYAGVCARRCRIKKDLEDVEYIRFLRMRFEKEEWPAAAAGRQAEG